jgi:hypothetical protein
LEGTSPHRIIHVNAAFSRHLILAGSGRQGRRFRNNSQEWIESQNQFSNSKRSLQEAIEEIIPENATLPLTCYPVVGSNSMTTHYLIEATNSIANPRPDSTHPQETMTLYRPFEAVG